MKWIISSLVSQSVKNLPAVQETRVWSLGWEDPLAKEMATHSSILAWKIHSFDYLDLYQQSNVSAFKYTVLVGHSFSSKEQVPFNFMAAVTIHSDFGAQENKVCHCFHCFSIYLPWNDGTACHNLSFLNGVLSQLFHFLLSLSLRGSSVPLHFQS